MGGRGPRKGVRTHVAELVSPYVSSLFEGRTTTHSVNRPSRPPGSSTSASAKTEGSSTASVPAPMTLTVSELVREHGSYVWRVLRSLGVPDSDVDDVCQETFLVILRKLPEFEGRSSLTTWIYGIALRVSSDYRKRAYRRHEVPSDVIPESTDSSTPQQELERAEAWRIVGDVLDSLAEPQRQVFVLYEIEQLTMNEVAAVVGCPLQTAYSRLHAARRHVYAEATRLRAGGAR